MALQKSLVITRYGSPIPLENLYICFSQIILSQQNNVVVAADGTKSRTLQWRITAVAAVYASREAKYANAQTLDEFPINGLYDVTTTKPMHQYLYDLVKETEFGAGAVNV